MKAYLAILISAFVLVPLAGAEVVEEETWYSADGKVVKKVKRTLTGADAKSEPDWEPAWVIRERARGMQSSRVTYSSARRYFRGSSYGSGLSYRCGTSYYYPGRYGRSGFTGFLRTGSGKTRWGLGYRSRGLNALFTR